MKSILLIAVLLGGVGIAQGEYSREFIKAMRKGADTFVEISVVDDVGLPVSNALVSVCYNIGSGREETHGMTGNDGKYAFRKQTNGYGEIEVTKEGFYHSESRFSFIDMGHEHEVDDDKWMPHPMKHQLVLKTIRHPSVKCVMKDLVIPVTNTWVGLDIVEHDWVPPFGNGQSVDLKINLEWDGKMQWQYTDMKLRIDFLGTNAYLADVDLGSSCPYVYKAQTNRFDTSTLSYYRFGQHPRHKKEFDKAKEIVVRCRCQTNSVNGVVFYNYFGIANLEFAVDNKGKPTLWMPCYFNPIPNDTNLEPSGK